MKNSSNFMFRVTFIHKNVPLRKPLNVLFWNWKQCTAIIQEINVTSISNRLLFDFQTTAWKVSKYGFFSGPYFPVFGHFSRRETFVVFFGIWQFWQWLFRRDGIMNSKCFTIFPNFVVFLLLFRKPYWFIRFLNFVIVNSSKTTLENPSCFFNFIWGSTRLTFQGSGHDRGMKLRLWRSFVRKKNDQTAKISLFWYLTICIQGGPQKCPNFSLEIAFTKIRKPSTFFLHRYWKFIEVFWWQPL